MDVCIAWECKFFSCAGREHLSEGFDYEPSPTKECETESGGTEKSLLERGPELTKIIEELFEALVSPNPALFEYGCDNMTAILIDLRPGLSCGCSCHEFQRKVVRRLHPERSEEEVEEAMESKRSTDGDTEETQAA